MFEICLRFKLNVPIEVDLPTAIHEVRYANDPEGAIHMAANVSRFIVKVLETNGIDVVSFDMLSATEQNT